MFSALPITPRYKMLLSYDIKNGMHSIYYRYVVSEFVPSLNEMGVYVTEAWHTAYGNYPVRMVEYVAEDLATLHSVLASDRWLELERRL